MKLKKIKISDLGTVITGNTPPRKKPHLYGDHTLFVKPTDIKIDHKYCYNPEECYSKEGYSKYIKSLIPSGSTCVVTIGSIGKKIIKSHKDLFINQAMNAVVPSDYFDQNYVFYLLKFNLNQLKTFDSGTASGRENVSKSSFSSIYVNIHEDLPTQQKIANRLSRYDDLIEVNLRRIGLLEELARETYEEWFVRGRFPGWEDGNFPRKEYWEVLTCYDILEVMSGGTPKTKVDEYWNGHIKFFTPKDASNYAYVDGTEKTVTELGVAKCNSKLYPKDTVFITARGTVGKINLANEPMIMNQSCYALRGKRYVTPYYLYCAMVDTIDVFKGMSTGGVFNTIVIDTFKILSFSLPPEQLVQQFEKFAEPIFGEVHNLLEQNNLLREARDLLLPRLMAGMEEV